MDVDKLLHLANPLWVMEGHLLPHLKTIQGNKEIWFRLATKFQNQNKLDLISQKRKKSPMRLWLMIRILPTLLARLMNLSS